MHVLVGDGHRRIARERRLTGEQLEEDDAGRVDVRALIARAAADLFRRAVRDRAHHHASTGRHVIELDRAGEAEICDLHDPVVGDQDVLGLDVAMHETGAVGRGERTEHRLDH